VRRAVDADGRHGPRRPSSAIDANVNEHSSDWAADRALVTELKAWRAADKINQARLHAAS